MSLMDHLTAHLRQRRVPVFPSFPAEHQPTYHKALEHFGHGQFATSSATLLSIPSEFNTYPSYVILRVRTLLAQGYYHNAIRYLRETIDMIDEREAEILKTGGGGIINGALGGAPPQIDASDEMMRDTWKLWIKVLYWDDEGMSSLENRDGRRKEWVGEALRAWKDWCEWTAIEGYSEVHSLLYELIHQLDVGTCSLSVREWTANTDALISHHMDAQTFLNALHILRVRNKVLNPKDPTFTSIMLEFLPNLGAHPEIKLIEARTRLILYEMHTLNGNYDLAWEKLLEIEDCLKGDGELHPGEEGRGVDLRWLVRFYKLSSIPPRTGHPAAHRMPDEDKLAKLSALAHEAVNRDIPEFQLKALNQLAVIYLRNRSFANFTAPETELVVKGQKYGQPALFWRNHLKALFENFPAPDHEQAEEFLDTFTRIMEGIEWARGEESSGGGGVIGVGLGLVVWTGIAEMIVGIEEFWRSKAKRMVERVKQEEGQSEATVDRVGMSKGLRRLFDETA